MKNRILVPAVVLVALLVASNAAFAQQPVRDTIDSELPSALGVKKLQKKHGGGERLPYPLPMPVQPNGGTDTALSFSGPEGKSGTSGVSIGSFGGGTAMMTPRQRADRQIRKVIRTLY